MYSYYPIFFPAPHFSANQFVQSFCRVVHKGIHFIWNQHSRKMGEKQKLYHIILVEYFTDIRKIRITSIGCFTGNVPFGIP